MPEDDSRNQNSLASRLASLHERRAELGRKYDDQIRFLREIAPGLVDIDEQQRIVGDIDDLREQMVQLEEEIWKLESRILDW